jgi:hypothetical protein
MAGAPIIIVGTMTDPEGKTMQVTITGVAASGDLVPSHPIAPGGPPPTVMPPIYYPPTPAHPIVLPPPTVSPPIYYPPVFPVQPLPPVPPGGVVAPPIYYPPTPSHPIVLPEPPEVPTEPPIAPPGGGISDGWQWYYAPGTGWILVWKPPGGGGKPQPPGGGAPAPSPSK